MKGHDEDAKASNVGNVNGVDAPDGLSARTAEAQPTANAAPAGIFSSPDMTVETTNLPPELGGSQPEEAKATNKSRVAAAFGKRGGGNNQARIDSAFAGTEAVQEGVVARSNSIASSAEGDIQLQKSAKKKSKWPVVVAIVVLLAAIAGGAWFFLKDRASVGRTVTLSDIKAAFAPYAQFVVYGKDTGSEIQNSCMKNSSCYFFQQRSDKEARVKFFQDNEERKQNLAQTVDGWGLTDGSDDSTIEISKKLRDHIQLYDFLKMFYETDSITKPGIVNKYLEGGADGVYAYLNNYYQIDQNNPYMNDFKADVDSFGQAVLQNLLLYDKLGCFETYMDDACFENVASEEDKAIAAENNTVISSFGSVITRYYNLSKALMEDIFSINQLLQREAE